jgi:hypothetical protein
MIQLWFTSHPAAFAGLVIHSCVVSLVRVCPYSDGYLLARPDSRASCIAASEPAHDRGVIILNTADVIVHLVEAEEEVVFEKEVGYFVMK